jgi:hypothetical protein
VPFHFTEEQRQALSSRLIVQPPPSAAAVERHADIARQRKRIEGLPIDVLEALEALRLLAEQGNLVARELYSIERERLGIDRPLHFASR